MDQEPRHWQRGPSYGGARALPWPDRHACHWCDEQDELFSPHRRDPEPRDLMTTTTQAADRPHVRYVGCRKPGITVPVLCRGWTSSRG